METNDTMPFVFSDEFSPKDKSQNIIKVIGVGGGGSNAVLNMYTCQKPKFIDKFLKKLGEVVDVFLNRIVAI